MERFPVRLEKRRQQKLTHCPNGVLSLSQDLGNFLDKKPLSLKEIFFFSGSPPRGTYEKPNSLLLYLNRCCRDCDPLASGFGFLLLVFVCWVIG